MNARDEQYLHRRLDTALGNHIYAWADEPGHSIHVEIEDDAGQKVYSELIENSMAETFAEAILSWIRYVREPRR